MTFPPHLKTFSKIKYYMQPLQPPYKCYISSIKFLSWNICTVWDTHPFLVSNLKFLTWRTQKFDLRKILPGTLSPTQIEPKVPKWSKIDPHLDHETGVHILLVFRYQLLPFQSLFQVPFNGATSSNHQKGRCIYNCWVLDWCHLFVHFPKFVQGAKVWPQQFKLARQERRREKGSILK